MTSVIEQRNGLDFRERRTRKHGGNTEDFVRAFELGRDDEHLGELRLERERRHDVSERGEVCGTIDISASSKP